MIRSGIDYVVGTDDKWETPRKKKSSFNEKLRSESVANLLHQRNQFKVTSFRPERLQRTEWNG
jgi:hypothetical protein